ncbi:TetR/AcrR family transcriptional regulator [Acidipropionibacterium jensenii]|uniref:Toluene efflux pump ttgABC operon repressor n=1 Tax=Acidipropionibacterium jensenii TaxID=1749 RepID=A0A448P1A0_9ACTN|nr:TetR/AcrR family transcriptional regulator [Acidipropionibacterium jensenii]MDN5976503.1 TetR/AcrR family transcriptional regulator [Acidipropionibacterium jensenii]MDN5995104.1 TetR/AcrR family transcriptional regulator [Acidipropionibacterium jensenii]MDN6426166.1 TetR/AcrR family transcriptional regulator [Acidipropionibacterium jensenii]MDN6440607.1 TetR/AcrR family transcriptional regulator [Acidipropionibacterium jensenii]MDN6479818.1 TetR/AcrR family transcriptional regulator [Acidip
MTTGGDVPVEPQSGQESHALTRSPGRRGATAQSILDAATHLFATRGVSATSVDDIALASGSAKGSVYYNFTSKAGLVEALMDEHAARVSDSIREASRGLTGAALQRAVVATLLADMHEHLDSARVLASEVFRTDRSWRESVSSWRTALMGPLDAIESGSSAEETGSVVSKESPDSRIGAAAIVGATLIAGLEWLIFHPDLPLDRVEDQIFRTLGLNSLPPTE